MLNHPCMWFFSMSDFWVASPLLWFHHVCWVATSDLNEMMHPCWRLWFSAWLILQISCVAQQFCYLAITLVLLPIVWVKANVVPKFDICMFYLPEISIWNEGTTKPRFPITCDFGGIHHFSVPDQYYWTTNRMRQRETKFRFHSYFGL